MELMLILSAASMFALMLPRCKKYNIPLFKTPIIVVLLAFFGVLSTVLLYFIENGEWNGKSFFGAVLFLPVIFLPISKILKVPTTCMMDFISLPGLIMFSVMKFNCSISGCCGGRLLWIAENGKEVYFPSPIVESVTTVLLVCVLLIFEHKQKTNNKLYPISLISYGILRFILNFFRQQEEPFFLGLQKGNIWALLAIIIGILWIFILAFIDVDKKLKSAQKQIETHE